jgi:hypothetical protein
MGAQYCGFDSLKDDLLFFSNSSNQVHSTRFAGKGVTAAMFEAMADSFVRYQTSAPRPRPDVGNQDNLRVFIN